MVDEFFEKGTEISGIGEICNSIIFIVSGKLELKIYDKFNDEYRLEILG